MNIIVKIITSLPVILICLNIIPILGIILSIYKTLVFKNKRTSFTISLIIIGILLFIFDKYDLQEYVTYINLFDYNILTYSKRLIILGVVLLLVSHLLKMIASKVTNKLFNYINKIEQMDYEVSKKTTQEIKIKQEKAKNTRYVKCKSCGADNLVSSKTQKCKYCRKHLK